MRKSWNLHAVLVHCSAQRDSAPEVLRQLYGKKANIHDYQIEIQGFTKGHLKQLAENTKTIQQEALFFSRI